MQQGQGEYIGQIRSWHSAMQNLSTINRIEHIEPEESVGSIIYSQDSVFVAFVRVFHDKDTTPNEAHIEQRVQAVYLYRRSKAPAEVTHKAAYESDGHTICSTSMQQA